MAQPKALLCRLGAPTPGESSEETHLRSAGFATAALDWISVNDRPHGWTRLAELIGETAGLCSWVVSGPPGAFTGELVSQVALINLSFRSGVSFSLAFILETSDQHEVDRLRAVLPPMLAWAKIYRTDEPFASRLMATRFKKVERPEMPFHLCAHLSPFTGIWLEAGPDSEEMWPGFFLGAVGAEIDSFGVGPRGYLPKKCTLEFPILGIEGHLNGQKWNGCAAKNSLDVTTSVFVRLTRPLDKFFMSTYPEDATDESSATVLSFNSVLD
jgi:hypothetical protein